MSFETPAAVVAELELYIENDGDLYRSQTTSILKALTTKKARGEYKHDLAVKAFEYLVEAGAKKYAKEFGSPGHPWHKMFDVATRRAVAKNFAKSFETEYALGNYDYLLPLKYAGLKQHREGTRQHSSVKSSSAAKKGKWNVPEGLAVRWAPVNNAWFLLWPTSAPLNRQQVLKIADTEEMHDFLRERYGATYGLAARLAHTGRGHTTIKKSPSQLNREISEALGSRVRR
jgi:hypothetical protein